jgi:Protein of unknown function (DUF2934)
MTDDTQERIRRRAYSIWEREGRPEGSHQIHWDQARAEIEAESVASRLSEAELAADVAPQTSGGPLEAEPSLEDPFPGRRSDVGKRKSSTARPTNSPVAGGFRGDA